MPNLIRNRWLALVGLVALLPLSWGLVGGDIGLDVAAMRAGVLLAVLVVVDHFVLPLTTLLLAPPNRRARDRGGAGPGDQPGAHPPA